MSFREKLEEIKRELKNQQLDGWLLYDFRRSNDLACQFLEIPAKSLLTRRFFYWIPPLGESIKIVHMIENPLEHLPGRTVRFRRWQDLEQHLETILSGADRIAMEYSPRNAIPYVSKVDAGTMDVVKGFDVKVVSSADLLQKYTIVWDKQKLQSHLYAADVLSQTVEKAWSFIGDSIKVGKQITEFDVQQFILKEFDKNDCASSDLPIVAVNGNASDPHYIPEKETAALMKKGDFVLIDIWCKQFKPNAVYADITRVAVIDKTPTQKQQQIFSIVKDARDSAVELVRTRFRQHQPLQGWEVDEVCRSVIDEAGFGEYFTHRTGHNIDVKDHGNGANIDNLETQDSRQLLPGTCFSIEPGIYLPEEFGIRLEYDVYIHHNGTVEITGGIQEEIECLLI